MNAQSLLLSRKAWAVGLVVVLSVGVALGVIVQRADTGYSACVEHWNADGSKALRAYAGTGGRHPAEVLTDAGFCSVWVRGPDTNALWRSFATGADADQGPQLGGWSEVTTSRAGARGWNADVSGVSGRLTPR